MAHHTPPQRSLPGSSFVCLLTSEGELIAHSGGRDSAQHEEDALAMAAALRSSALKFVASLNQLDCHVIHVAGEEAVFSCYDVVTTAAKSKGEPSRSMLTFYSDSPSDGFDTAGVDATVRATLASSARRGTPHASSLSLSLSLFLSLSLSRARALLPRPPSPPSRPPSHPPSGRRSHALSRTAPACR